MDSKTILPFPRRSEYHSLAHSSQGPQERISVINGPAASIDSVYHSSLEVFNANVSHPSPPKIMLQR